MDLPHLGLVAQLEERCLCKAEALGSNPSESIYRPARARKKIFQF
jgi:hypothetical protein